MNWDQVVKKVSEHVVKIETPSGSGTGFLLLYNETGTWCGVATAEHVVSHADEWQEPIKIVHDHTKTSTLLKTEERVIYKDWKTDSSVILFLKSKLELPQIPITLFPMGSFIDIGSEVGWLGYPAIAPYTLCFFSGNVSARQDFRNAYLIDGVTINGVSGSPVLHLTETEGVQIVGVITAYSPNRATGETLPGLSIAQDVSNFHDVIKNIRSLDEANRKKAEFEKHQGQMGQESQGLVQ